MWQNIILLILCGLADRVRGGFPSGRPSWIAHPCMAFAYASMVSLVTPNPWVIAGGALLGLVAWRQDNGWRGNWVRDDGKDSQYGQKLITQPLQWGLVWFAPWIALAYLTWKDKDWIIGSIAGLVFGIWLTMIMTVPTLCVFAIAAPAGALITIHSLQILPTGKGKRRAYTDWSGSILGLSTIWAWSELLELPIIGLIVLALV